MLEKKSFTMSMFANSADLYKAKAEYYEQQAEKLHMELVVSLETTGQLERSVLKLDNTCKRLYETLDNIERTSNALGEG